MGELEHKVILVGKPIDINQLGDCTSIEIIANEGDYNLSEDLPELLILKSLGNLKRVFFYCYNYDQLKIFNDHFKDSSWEMFFILLDDKLLADRSYIKPIEGAKLYVPIVYQMWGLRNYDVLNSGYYFYPDIPPNCSNIDTYNQTYKNNVAYMAYIDLLNNQINSYPNISELEKIIFISNYFMANFQYVGGRVTTCKEFEYITDTYDENAHPGFNNVDTLFKNKFGICCTFALGYWVANNNPLININCGIVHADIHDFNYIRYEGLYYGNDATWLITRNPNQVAGALKASSFSDEYILMGKDKLDTLNHHRPHDILPFRFASKSIDRKDIIEARKRLESLGVRFDYGNQVPMPSYCRIKTL